MFRVLKKDSNVLIYNYITYHSLFSITWLWFIRVRSQIIGNIYKEPGNFLTILVGSEDFEDRLQLSKTVIDVENIFRNIGAMSRYNRDCNIIEILKLINRLIYVSRFDMLPVLLDMAYNKDYMGFIKIILGDLHDYDYNIRFIGNDEIKNAYFNIINSCLFVVKDLDALLHNISLNNYNVNAGPQKWRGQVNSINSFLSILDMDYRKSLLNHNYYHTRVGNLDGR